MSDPVQFADLSALQERYPVGSRWHRGNRTDHFIVAGHHRNMVLLGAADTSYVISVAADHMARENWQHVPDAPPCPITEPVTTRQNRYWPRTFNPNYLGPEITLYPEGQEPPEGAPRAFYTWGES